MYFSIILIHFFRLISSHQRLSKLNHELEERLLDTVSLFHCQISISVFVNLLIEDDFR